MEWILIFKIIICYVLLAWMSFMYGFQSLYIIYDEKLNKRPTKKPKNWPYSTKKSKFWCNILIVFLIVGLGTIPYFTKMVWVIYEPKLWLTITIAIIFTLLYCFIISLGLINGEFHCEKRVKELCEENSLDFPNINGN